MLVLPIGPKKDSANNSKLNVVRLEDKSSKIKWHGKGEKVLLIARALRLSRLAVSAISYEKELFHACVTGKAMYSKTAVIDIIFLCVEFRLIVSCLPLYLSYFKIKLQSK